MSMAMNPDIRPVVPSKKPQKPKSGGIGNLVQQFMRAPKRVSAGVQGAAAGQAARNRAQGGGAPRPSGGGGGYSPARPQGGSGISYGGGPVTSNSTGQAQAVVEPPKPQAFDDWKSKSKNYRSDSAYTSQMGAIDSEYKNLIDQLTRQNTDYTTNFETGLRNMGLSWDGSDYASGSWNPQDALGAYGQAHSNQLNDFSGRGLMDSSFMVDAQQQLTDRFDRQRGSMLDALSQENQAFEAGKTGAETTRQSATQQALAEAYARYVAGFGA